MSTSPASTRKILVIERPRLGDLVAMRRLFRAALHHDFDYFPASTVRQIDRQNSLTRLALARRHASRVMRVAKLNGRIIGYAIGSLTPAGNGELYWLYVDPAARQRGVGNGLLQAATTALRDLGAERVTLVTYNLKDYYARHGYHYRGKQHLHGLDLDVMEYHADGQ